MLIHRRTCCVLRVAAVYPHAPHVSRSILKWKRLIHLQNQLDPIGQIEQIDIFI